MKKMLLPLSLVFSLGLTGCDKIKDDILGDDPADRHNQPAVIDGSGVEKEIPDTPDPVDPETDIPWTPLTPATIIKQKDGVVSYGDKHKKPVADKKEQSVIGNKNDKLVYADSKKEGSLKSSTKAKREKIDNQKLLIDPSWPVGGDPDPIDPDPVDPDEMLRLQFGQVLGLEEGEFSAHDLTLDHWFAVGLDPRVTELEGYSLSALNEIAEGMIIGMGPDPVANGWSWVDVDILFRATFVSLIELNAYFQSLGVPPMGIENVLEWYRSDGLCETTSNGYCNNIQDYIYNVKLPDPVNDHGKWVYADGKLQWVDLSVLFSQRNSANGNRDQAEAYRNMNDAEKAEFLKSYWPSDEEIAAFRLDLFHQRNAEHGNRDKAIAYRDMSDAEKAEFLKDNWPSQEEVEAFLNPPVSGVGYMYFPEFALGSTGYEILTAKAPSNPDQYPNTMQLDYIQRYPASLVGEVTDVTFHAHFIFDSSKTTLYFKSKAVSCEGSSLVCDDVPLSDSYSFTGDFPIDGAYLKDNACYLHFGIHDAGVTPVMGVDRDFSTRTQFRIRLSDRIHSYFIDRKTGYCSEVEGLEEDRLRSLMTEQVQVIGGV